MNLLKVVAAFVATFTLSIATEGGNILRATCDNRMTVYVDGVEQEVNGLSDWTRESQIALPSYYQSLAIKCVDVGVKVGILASVQNEAGEDLMVTDNSWTCTQEPEEGWNEPGFMSDTWEVASVIGKHGMRPWGKIGQISENASWIWTKNQKAYTTVYCRYTPVYMHTLRATCDNKMTLYIDGVEQQLDGQNDWRKESKVEIPSNFQVLAIKCVDVGVKVGILASVQDEAGEDVLVSDDSWSCSQVEEEGWTEPDFAETSEAWETGSVIGKHGVAPWRKIGQISESASWIWTKNQRAYTKVYCRYSNIA